MNQSMHKYLVEFLGTMFFLYIIIATNGNALAIGSSLALAIIIGGKISGGNFNPAVTIMMAMAKRMSTADVLPYIFAQILGGFCALELHKNVRF